MKRWQVDTKGTAGPFNHDGPGSSLNLTHISVLPLQIMIWFYQTTVAFEPTARLLAGQGKLQ
jgi:hypothetical protein